MVVSGQYDSIEVAKLAADAARLQGGAVDETTASMLRQIEAAERQKEALERLARDPVKEWRGSAPTWIEAGRQIEADAIGHVKEALSEFIKTGKMDIDSLGEAILGTVADIVADKAVKELHTLLGGEDGSFLGPILGDTFSSRGDADLQAMAGGGAGVQQAFATGSQTAATNISQAMLQAGQTVSQSLSAAMGQGGAQVGSQVRTAHVTGGAQAASQTRAAGIQIGASVQRAGSQHSSEVGSSIRAAGSQHAQMVGAASAGSAAGAGAGALGAAGAGGVEGQIASMAVNALLGAIPMFRDGGVTPSSGAGVALLHDNEAVIPLRGGRVPVELNGQTGGGQQIVQNFNWTINTPDADSFRRSQSQIAADAAAAGQRALSQNR
jgi:hypothetical protein